jgi:taurine transport system substrate-binding protein
MKIRSLIASYVMVLAMCSVAVAHAEDRPKVVRMSWFANATPMVLGKADGSLEKRLGVPVQWQQLASGGAVLSALAANELDIGMIGGPPTTAGLARGLPIDVLCFEGLIGTSERLIARPGIKAMKDLEGKRVAYTPGSSTDYAIHAALRAYNVDASRVTMVTLAPPDIVAAWKRGDIDAGYAWSPFTYQLAADQGHDVISTKALQQFGYIVWNNYIIRREFAHRYPSTVVALLRAYNDYVKAYRNDPAGVSRTIAAHLGQDEKTVADTLAGRDFYTLEEQLASWMGTAATKDKSKMNSSFMDMAKFLNKNGDIKNADMPKSFAPMINPTFAEQAVR